MKNTGERNKYGYLVTESFTSAEDGGIPLNSEYYNEKIAEWLGSVLIACGVDID